MQQNAYNPPRFWWLKRLVCAGVAYMVLLLAVRLWWGWEAERRFSAAIEKRRAAGQPVLVEDFVREPLADENNAAHFFNRAAKAITLPDGVQLSDLLDTWRNDPDASRAQVSAFLDSNREVVRLIRKARGCSVTDWKVPLRSPVLITSPTPGYSSAQRALARLSVLAAGQLHDLGDEAAALEALRDTLAIGRAASAPGTIGQLTRHAIDGLAIWIIEDITPDLQVNNADATAQGDAGPCSREQVNELVKDLVTSDFEQDWLQSLWFERMLLVDAAHCLAEGKTPVTPPFVTTAVPFAPLRLRVAVWAVKPAWLLDSELIADRIDRFSESALNTWPVAHADLLLPSGPDLLTYQVAHFPSKLLGLGYDSLQAVTLRALAQRRMAAAALAIRLYELDYGRRPDRLADLVPDYLPAVPSDPFAADDRPLGYAPHAPRPVLYSVNLDSVDERGLYVVNSRGAIERDAADLPFFLNGDRPRPPPAPSAPGGQSAAAQSAPASQSSSVETVPDDHEVEHTERDDGR